MTTTPPHEHLKFKLIQTTATFNKGVTAEWVARMHPTRSDWDNTEYAVTVKGVPNKSYSLFSLMIQAVLGSVEIKNDKSLGTVTLIDGANNRKVLGSSPITVPGTAQKSGSHSANEIWFLEFTDKECRLLIEAKGRPKIGPTAWDGPSIPPPGGFRTMGSHDNVPPGGTTEK